MDFREVVFMSNIVLEKMFEMNRWEELIDKALEKGINKNVLRELSKPETRAKFYLTIRDNNYEIAPPHIAQIPKDNGTFREVYVNEDIDRIFLSLANDVLSELYGDMIHPCCTSYQKGKGCGQTVQKVSSLLASRQGHLKVGYKADLSKYFDSVKIEVVDKTFDEMQEKYDLQDCPVFRIIRNYYHNDYVFDVEGKLIQHYGSLKQGCAVASLLANIVLRDIDEQLSNMNIVYCRYSDDILMIGDEADKAIEILKEKLVEKGLSLNPKKVETLYSDKWFTFLGFKLKESMITLSKKRVKNFQKEIEERTIKQNINVDKAKANVIRYLYKGTNGDAYTWARTCLPIVNVQKDLIQLDNFVKDCIRACATGKKKIGGLGSVNDREDYTILRGKGKNVKANRIKTEMMIAGYIGLAKLAQDIKRSKSLYDTQVRRL